MTTLDKSYCVPSTEDEWAAIDALNPRIELRMKGQFVYTLKEHGKRRLWVCHREKGNAKEIPVSRFLDLWHDRIVTWRLEEVGFKFDVMGYGFLDLKNEGSFLKYTSDGEVFWCAYRQQITTKAFITTFTDLLTLIGMLTPNTNKP